MQTEKIVDTDVAIDTYVWCVMIDINRRSQNLCSRQFCFCFPELVLSKQFFMILSLIQRTVKQFSRWKFEKVAEQLFDEMPKRKYLLKILHYMRQMAVITPYAQFLFSRRRYRTQESQLGPSFHQAKVKQTKDETWSDCARKGYAVG